MEKHIGYDTYSYDRVRTELMGVIVIVIGLDSLW